MFLSYPGSLDAPMLNCITEPCVSTATDSITNEPAVANGYLDGRIDKVLFSDWVSHLFGLKTPGDIQDTAPEPSDPTGGTGQESRLAIGQESLSALIIVGMALGAFFLLKKG
ncbi:MAG TPA: hypothetical protein VKA67_01990 [Verrucomicrobiae bacterium]|nr:hypothetical protein [Verrucomicrobiae bacterium]